MPTMPNFKVPFAASPLRCVCHISLVLLKIGNRYAGRPRVGHPAPAYGELRSAFSSVLPMLHELEFSGYFVKG